MHEITQRAEPAWPAVYSVALGVFGLVTAEFLPASLLTPMAEDMGISEGMAGQTVTVTAAVALVTGLLVTSATRRIDRRLVMLTFSMFLIVSNLLVALAPSLTMLLLGRVLLGIAIGGFWAMSVATLMRLVPEKLVPRALSITYSGVSVATVAAAPLGSYFGAIIGWRNVFLMAALVGLLIALVQYVTLPRMASSGMSRLRTLVDVLVRPRVGTGILAAGLVFIGHFAFFTYVRPFLETVIGAEVNEISAILLGFGAANFLGNFIGGLLIERNLRLVLIISPVLMGTLGLSLIGLPESPLLGGAMVALWGLAFGAVPIAWSTWLSQTVPDEAESAGGLLSVAIQLAIATGAAAGGGIFNVSGVVGVVASSGIVLLLAGLLINAGVQIRMAATTASQDGSR